MAEQPRTQRLSQCALPGRHTVGSVLPGGGQSVGGEVIREFLPRTPGCGSFARGLLTERLSGRVDALILDDARLVVPSSLTMHISTAEARSSFLWRFPLTGYASS
jgi:hypothetical protein